MIRRLSTILCGSVLLLGGCGSLNLPAPSQAPGLATFTSLFPGEIAALGGHKIPTNFTIVTGVVVTLLPPDTHGNPHQEFRIKLSDPTPGKILEVNHNTAMAPEVADLDVGEKLVIRGVTYSDSQAGIHWTHHAVKPGDAGYIKTEDGKIYE